VDQLPVPERFEDDDPEDEKEEKPAFQLIAGFFLIPGAVVTVGVLLFLLFGWLTGERRTAHDYLAEVKSGRVNRRFQAAFELSQMLINDDGGTRDPSFAREVAEVFAHSQDQDPRIRRYLALALGRLGDPVALELLTAVLDDPDTETRIYAAWGLGTLGDARAVPSLARIARNDADSGVRKMAVHALGALPSPATTDVLRAALDDVEPDVRWNAALSLARQGNPSGAPILRRAAEREYLASLPGMSEEQRVDVTVEAIKGLALLGDSKAEALFTRLSQEDPNLKVRQAAFEALAVLTEAGAMLSP
jgi:hypothetical protein